MHTRRGIGLICVALAMVCRLAPASAHEVRPALLRITEQPDGHYEVLWKKPASGLMGLHLVPRVSGGWLNGNPDSTVAAPDFEIDRWRGLDAGSQGLDGRTVSVEGLNRSITDVVVSVKLVNREAIESVLSSARPSMTLDLHEAHASGRDFLWLGICHILAGADHLLFMWALLLIVRERWMLVKTVSAFTIAHSLTLALATLGDLRLPTALLNALIALSILFVAGEAVRVTGGGSSLTTRRPWLVAGGFGLLHGMGFASGLAALALPERSLVTALLSFNVGVEIGQLGFIALVLALRRALRLMEFRLPRRAALVPAYVIGTSGALWTIQMTTVALGYG